MARRSQSRTQSPSHARQTPARSARAGRFTGGTGYWIYGLHAVEAALRNPDRITHELLATTDAAAALRTRFPEHPPQIVERERLDRLCERDAVHQGLCLRVAPLTPPTILDVLEQRSGPVLILDQVTDPRNIGAILRSAAAFGAAAVLVQDRNTPPETGTMAKAASGALDIVPVLREVNLARAISALQEENLWVVGLDAGGNRLDGTSYGSRRLALVLGAEGSGLRRLTRESCDEIASVYMPGNMESLNVSNAAAVALYELAR